MRRTADMNARHVSWFARTVVRVVAMTGLMVAAWVGPACADWRSETGTFRIGVVARPDRGGSAVDYAPAASAVSARIGMPVEFVPFLNYPALIDAQLASRVEYEIPTSNPSGATGPR